jgi:geranylgeranyl pyrophosphate synthase
MWTLILVFVFSPSENRVKSVVERPWIFGFRLRPFVFFGEKKPEEIIKEQKAQEESEIQNTHELIRLMFPGFFTKELLEEYIRQANELKYPDDSTENRRKAKLLELFDGILASLKKG